MLRAENLKEAFSKAQTRYEEFLGKLPLEDKVRVYWEGDEDAGMDIEQTITRRDVPVSRRRWQFTNRSEHYATINLKGG